MSSLAHSLRSGGFRRWIWIVAALLAALLFSLYLADRRGRGPATEAAFEPLLLARSLARGEGFRTPVNHPHTVALLQVRGNLELSQALPDLHQAPLYPLVLAAPLWLVGAEARAAVFAPPHQGARREHPTFNADRYTLGVNLLLLWIVLGLAGGLAARLHTPATGAWVAAAGLLSAGLWDDLLGLGGGLLEAALVLGCFHLLLGLERRDPATTSAPAPLLTGLGLGTLGALIGLTDYPSLLVLPILAGYLGLTQTGRPRQWLLAGLLGAALLVLTPWLARNLEWTGRPLALYGEGLALRAGDPTAEPLAWRAQLDAAAPEFSAAKWLNKGLFGLRESTRSELWAAGGLFMALFAVSVLYRFRRTDTDRLHRLALALLLVLVVTAPFLGDGAPLRRPAFFLMPLALVFGAGFLRVLLESTAERGPWKRAAWVGGLITVHALPLLHLAAEPPRLAFQYPPYWPTVFPEIARFRAQTAPEAGLVSDIPAGTAWYGDTRVWAQPRAYGDFSGLFAHQDIAVQLFSAATLDRPFFRELAPKDHELGIGPDVRSWPAVYEGLAKGKLPRFYPLPAFRQLQANLFVTYRSGP